MITKDARRITWEGAGRPLPIQYDGGKVPCVAPPTGSVCPRCGAPHGDLAYAYSEVFGETFWPVRTAGQLFGHDGSLFCVACTWSVRALALRCAAWIARENGVWFVPQRSLLAVLLDPPEPPFVVAWPRYGIEHGGEAHAHRAMFRGNDPLHRSEERLSRLQSKHTGIYAQTAYSRTRYPVQIDDTLTVVVDVPLWTNLRERLTSIATMLRAEGCGVTATREALTTLKPPRVSQKILLRWPALVDGLATHRKSAWWGALCSLLPIPAADSNSAPSAPRTPAVVAPAGPPPPERSPQVRQLALL